MEPAAPYAGHIGRVESSEDSVWPHLLERLANTLQRWPIPRLEMPALWHWMLFQSWNPPTELGFDGHARRGGFLPLAPHLPHRVLGGGRVRFHSSLRAGEKLRRTSSIRGIRETRGASGPLMIVTVAHEIRAIDRIAISEEQDIIYRSAAEPGAAASTPAGVPPDGVVSRCVTPDPVLLFRFSALTGNSHRIHYDQQYAHDVEGHAGLVVQGPLQAIWLADLASTSIPDMPFTQFNYRAHRPAIAGNPLILQAWRESALVRLRTLDPTGAVCMSATAVSGPASSVAQI